jgi:hypothetical protein
MEFIIHSYRHAESIIKSDILMNNYYEELEDVIKNIKEDDLIHRFNEQKGNDKSISRVLNKKIKDELVACGWLAESPIFADDDYKKGKSKGTWRLDFTKDKLSVEVSFNHGQQVAWNLIKPVLASELNHVKKAVQTEVAIVICATEDLKVTGGFDNAIANFE